MNTSAKSGRGFENFPNTTMNPQIENQLSELELKHALHRRKMDDQHEDKHRAREWHRNPNRRRSTPPNVLV